MQKEADKGAIAFEEKLKKIEETKEELKIDWFERAAWR